MASITIAGENIQCDASGALYRERDSVLVVSDLHFEKGSFFARRGSFMPPYETAETLRRLSAVIDAYQPRTVISLGDSFHDNEGPSRMPEIYRYLLLELMEGREWFWISGNHDPAPPEGLPGTCVALSFDICLQPAEQMRVKLPVTCIQEPASSSGASRFVVPVLQRMGRG